MRAVDVVIPTMKKPHAIEAIESLEFMPWPMSLHLVSEGNSWPSAINIGLSRSRGDVVLMDDDIRLDPRTFLLVDQFYNQADIFGFKLLYPTGRIQHAGGIFNGSMITHRGHREEDEGQYDEPAYCCHVTTSLIYIKKNVLDDIGVMDESYTGYQYEDIDFNFRALKAGYKILYLPSPAIHLESASKKDIPDFDKGMHKNYVRFRMRHMLNADFCVSLLQYPKPFCEVSNAA